MKKLIFFMLLSHLCFSQNDSIVSFNIDSSIDNFYPSRETIKSNSKINPICQQRGHISQSTQTTTSHCEPIVFDEVCHTKAHVDWCNSTSYICIRCGETIVENGFIYFHWKSKNCNHKIKSDDHE